MRTPFLGLGGCLLVALTTLAAAPSAWAADCNPEEGSSTCVDSDNLWPEPGEATWLSLGGTQTTQPGKVSFGLVTSYLSRPIGLRATSADPDGTVTYAVDNLVDTSFLLAYGITDRLEVGLATMAVLYQDGAGLSDVEGTNDELPRTAIRQLRFGLAYDVLGSGRVGPREGLGLAARLQLAVPTGSPDAFSRSRGGVFAPSIDADYRFDRFAFGAEVGARVRTASELAGAVIGTQLKGGLGASVRVLDHDLLVLGLEGFALVGLDGQAPRLSDRGAFASGPPLVPAEWIASASTALPGTDLRLTLGGGSSIPTAEGESAVTAPRFRFDLGIRFAPLGRDADGDGVPDRDDRCPSVAEDRDGFEDADGCPDLDNDGDGIPDELDRCRDEAETLDGTDDEDGCPDIDDDHDGVPDAEDKCRNAPEDKDGFQDEDGCPDPDNDGDGRLDGADKCPNGAEDKDGFRDEDGCPDPDNDLDGIPDTADQCPDQAEDKDGFQDEDGCPDPDNDGDGIVDANDKCPTQAETIDGNADEDGCPEPGARSLVAWSGSTVVLEGPAVLTPGLATLSKAIEAQIRMAATLLAAREPLQSIIVEGYGDREGDESVAAQTLAARRAEAVKAVLVGAGIASDRIAAAAGDLSQKRPPRSPSFQITAIFARPKATP